MTIFIFFLSLYCILFINKIGTKDILIEQNSYSIPNISIVPFKTFYPSINNNTEFSAKDYYENIHLGNLYLEIEVGKGIKNIELTEEAKSKIKENKQFITFFIILNDFTFSINNSYFINDERKKSICRYSSELSTSYELNEYEYLHNDKKSSYAYDYFKIFSDFSLSKYNMINMAFKHIFYHDQSKVPFACGTVGLLIPNQSPYISVAINYIHQLHAKIKNLDYSFTFKYNNDGNKNIDDINEGLFIVGLESIEKNKNTELIQIYNIQTTNVVNPEWKLSSDKVFIGNESFFFRVDELIIKTDIEGIEIPYVFYDKLKSKFFNHYFKNEKCKYEIINHCYVTFCDSNKFSSEDIQSFPNISISIYKLDFNFTFSGKELFYNRDNKYFFKIISYFSNSKSSFSLGRIFLKKYKVIFNPDSKSMYFYKNNSDNNIGYNNENKDKDIIIDLNKSGKNVFLLVISYFFIGILFLGCGIYFGRKFCSFHRKIYANELEDGNYVYEPNNKNLKKNQKLIDL